MDANAARHQGKHGYEMQRSAQHENQCRSTGSKNKSGYTCQGRSTTSAEVQQNAQVKAVIHKAEVWTHIYTHT